MSSNTPATDPPSADPFASPSVPAPASPEAPVAFPPPESPTPGLARGTSAPGAEAERAAAPAPDPTGSRPDAPNGELAGTARTRRPRTGIVILAVLLAVVVVAGGLGFFWLATQLQEARTQIGDQQQQITDQQRRLDEQQEMIDRKEEFGAAMDDLYGTVDTLVGLPYATIVPWNRVENLAESAWNHRRNANGLAQDVEVAKDLTTEISGLSAGVADQAASNASGTAWEATLDSLGRGWVSTVFDDTTPCGATALACVTGAEPFTVHVRADTRTDPAMTDWIRTGAAYHEYAHVLQFTNPGPTDAALASFGGDVETMADCYALTFLDGWSLDHEVSIDEYSYYEVSVGYGYTCDASQRQVIRDWVGRLGVTRQTVGG